MQRLNSLWQECNFLVCFRMIFVCSAALWLNIEDKSQWLMQFVCKLKQSSKCSTDVRIYWALCEISVSLQRGISQQKSILALILPTPFTTMRSDFQSTELGNFKKPHLAERTRNGGDLNTGPVFHTWNKKKNCWAVCAKQQLCSFKLINIIFTLATKDPWSAKSIIITTCNLSKHLICRLQVNLTKQEELSADIRKVKTTEK